MFEIFVRIMMVVYCVIHTVNEILVLTFWHTPRFYFVTNYRKIWKNPVEMWIEEINHIKLTWDKLIINY